MQRRIGGGGRRGRFKSATEGVARSSAFTLGALTIVACSAAKDPTVDGERSSNDQSSRSTASPSSVGDGGVGVTEPLTQPTEPEAVAATTSDPEPAIPTTSNATATTADAGDAPRSSDGQSPDNDSLPAAEGPDHAYARGGTRLSAVHFTAGNAARFLHFYDRILGRECAFEKIAGQSDYACAPAALVAVYYLDAMCTQPIVLSQDGAIEPALPAGSVLDPLVPVPHDFVGSWVTTRGAASCLVQRYVGSLTQVTAPGSDLPELGNITAVYEVGERFALTANAGSTWATVFKLENGACRSTPGVVRGRNPADSAYPLEPRAIDELVTAELRTFAAGEEFKIQRLIGSDGSWQTLAAVDRSGESCEFIADERCVPGPIAQLSHARLFANVSCAEPMEDVLVSSGQPCGERYGVTGSGETRVFELASGAESGYYQQSQVINPDTGDLLGLECGAIGSDWVATGEASREFSTAESVLVGARALRARTSVAPGTAVSLRRDVAFVLENDAVCDVNLFEDGVYRCHPATPGVLDGVNYVPQNRVQFARTDVYGDPDCSQHVYMAQAEANRDLPLWNLTTSFHVMTPFDGALYQDYGDVCSPMGEVSFGDALFLEGDELPLVLPVIETSDL
jgi:hypothetical protein